MRRGFSYLWVLILALVLLSTLATLLSISVRERQTLQLDRQQIQAAAYAESGLLYYTEIAPTLPCTVTLNYGSFTLTEKQGILYSSGYCARAKQVLQYKDKAITPWHE